jgi:GNAT superfamily N-acetyltransferase
VTVRQLKLAVRELTPDLWPDLEELFGEKGACNGCWCMYWRIGSEYRKRPRSANKRAFRKIVKAGPPPGLLAYAGDLAVGWCQITPRAELAWLDRSKSFKPVDAVPVWSISCFYVRIGYRRQGVTRKLIRGALTMAKERGAVAVEAYPLDSELSPSATHTGYVSTFEREGFREVALHAAPRPIMRFDLRRARGARQSLASRTHLDTK